MVLFYNLYKRDLIELLPGHVIKIGKTYYIVTGVNVYRPIVTDTIPAGETRTINFVDRESSSGTNINHKGFVGNIDQKYVVWLRWLSLGTNVEVRLKFAGDYIPAKSSYKFSSSNIPDGDPLLLNRISFNSNMYLVAEIDNSAGASDVTQTFKFDVREIFVDEFKGVPKTYMDITPSGFPILLTK